MSFQRNWISNNNVVMNWNLTLILIASTLSQRAPISYVMSVGVCLFLRISRAHNWGGGNFVKFDIGYCNKIWWENSNFVIIGHKYRALYKHPKYDLFFVARNIKSPCNISVRKKYYQFVISFFRVSVLSALSARLPLDGYLILRILRKSVQKIHIWLKLAKLAGALH